ncbi:transcriptional regulator [Streptomyces sp. NPDC091272]|uniref:transcriptional regulator n=1 Tax=Streptomyces sp. NPDC091272 TaxID=3365981 RepID=UPI003813A2BC
MAGRNQDFGRYGARGIKGSEATRRKLDSLAGGIATPVTEKRGLMARLRYLNRSERSKAAAQAAGLNVTPRTMKAWMEGKRAPSKKNLERIENAYGSVRKKNVARTMKTRLNNDGRGTRVEIHPANTSQVPQPQRRVAEHRNINVRDWDGIVDAWAQEDSAAMDTEWENVIVDLGSQWGQYEYVTNVGFSA